MSKTTSIAVLLGVMVLWVGPVFADPLPGQFMKFQQLPLDGKTITTSDGKTDTYWGHDELSTAWSTYISDPTGGVKFAGYVGQFMADDFADRANTPVVHVRWWGSYLRNEIIQPVDKFLIAFETDVPAAAGGTSFSHPGSVLLSQIVTKGLLAPGSGTYTEKLITPTPPAPEALYEYNAELRIPFNQFPCEIYWLKIVALVDVPPGVEPGTAPVTEWGWHNRDWTEKDPLACTPADGVFRGEHDQGPLGGDASMPIWHFQDDAVTGLVGLPAPVDPVFPAVVQDPATFVPTHYIDLIDGPDGIGAYSKDLAFELYTIPEPGTLLLLAFGGLAAVLRRRSQRQ